MDSRPPTSAGNRPGSMYGGHRPPSTIHPTTPMTPMTRSGNRTASRLVSAAPRPGTRSGLISRQITVADRPVSQQGLMAPKTGARITQRQIQDKSYFMGLLRSKVVELQSEIARMVREMDVIQQEQATYISYEKRAETLAAELKDLQGQLADYNLLVDKLNTDTEVEEVERECQELKEQNNQEAKMIDSLFEDAQAREMQIKQLEVEIEQECNMADGLIAAMKPELRQKYSELKKENQDVTVQLDKLQQQVDTLNGKKKNLEDELSLSQVKQEALNLYKKLREVEERRDTLIEEERGKGTPAEERERLLQQVKQDNAELATIEKKTTETKEQISKLLEELEHLEQELEEHQGERSMKYRELRKREETMDAFLNSFPKSKQTEDERQNQLENNVVALLENISRNLAHFQQMPTQQDYNVLRDDLQFKESELEKSRATVSSLEYEHKKLTLDLEKIEQLENKVQQEMESLQNKIHTMEQEMVVYGDLDQLRTSCEEKRKRLQEEQKRFLGRREETKKMVSDLNSSYEAQKAKLNENDTYTQLCNLERRWQHQEQNNFALKEFISTKTASTDYSALRKLVYSQIEQYNKVLQENSARATLQ